MDLTRLLRPRSIAVVGASERDDSYAGETLLNLRGAGFAGPVWGVNPKRSSAHGFPCFPSLSELPEPPDAVVVGIPAAAVPEVVDEAGSLGCGGVIVYGAGFGEVPMGAGHERRLREAAERHSLPVCGPNGNGIVAVHSKAAMWGDTLGPLEAGPVALVSQSGNVGVNALATRRGLRWHTVVSCGNSVAVDPAAWVAELARDESVRSIALYLEADGDGALLCDALAECRDHGVGVTVLKVGESPAGAAAAAAHTGAVAGDQRVFRALVEEAGGAWAEDVHDLLELAKALAVPKQGGRAGGSRAGSALGDTGSAPGRPRGADSVAAPGLAVLTCSGGDSALAADECARMGLSLPRLSDGTAARLRELLPDAATVGNPLDYTALIWGDVERLRDIVVTVGEDPAIDRVLVFYDQAGDVAADDSGRAASWAAVRDGIRLGAQASGVPVMVSSTLPELLNEEAALTFLDAGVPAVAGLRTGLCCAAALEAPPADPARLREIASAARAAAAAPSSATAGASSAAATPAPAPALPNGRRWLSEHEAKELVRSAGVPVVEGRLVADEEDAVVALSELGGHVAVKLSAPSLQHKADLGALVLGVATEEGVREAHRRLTALAIDGAEVLVERMAGPGAELIVAARADAVVPALVVGAGGIWTEALGDAAVVPLPAAPERVEAAIRGLRAAALFSGGRGRPALDVPAAARLAAAAGDLLLAHGLELIELNPVLVHEQGALAVDAVAAAPEAPAPTPGASAPEASGPTPDVAAP
jgi:acetate---CoA ligase (ADP-forming)